MNVRYITFELTQQVFHPSPPPPPPPPPLWVASLAINAATPVLVIGDRSEPSHQWGGSGKLRIAAHARMRYTCAVRSYPGVH